MERARLRPLPPAWGVILLGVMLAGPTLAGQVTVIPKTNHSALTMSTDGSYGFQVLPGKPLQLDLVGPGRLTVTVRLNHPRKRKAFTGTLEIRRNKKRIKRAKLRLFRSRSGNYNEDASINPSLPKVFKVKVPKGVQAYSFQLRARRPTSMTLGIEYDTKADQSAVAADDLALVPLIPPDEGVAAAPPPDDIALVPLTPLVDPAAKKSDDKALSAKASDTPAASDKPTAATKPPEDRPAGDGAAAGGDKIAAADSPGPAAKPAETPATRPTRGSARKVETIEPRTTKPPEITGAAPESPAFLSVGAKLGEINPMQNIGSAAFTASLDLRYILPVFEGRLSLGVEAGYHHYSAAVGYSNSATQTNVEMDVVPISLQLFYRIPLGTFIEPFVGLGGDLILGFAEVAYAGDPDSTSKGSALGFGGHVSAGAEAALGPGYLVLEVRAGFSKVDLEVVDNVNASGLAVVAGYRFEI